MIIIISREYFVILAVARSYGRRSKKKVIATSIILSVSIITIAAYLMSYRLRTQNHAEYHYNFVCE